MLARRYRRILKVSFGKSSFSGLINTPARLRGLKKHSSTPPLKYKKAWWGLSWRVQRYTGTKVTEMEKGRKKFRMFIVPWRLVTFWFTELKVPSSVTQLASSSDGENFLQYQAQNCRSLLITDLICASTCLSLSMKVWTSPSISDMIVMERYPWVNVNLFNGLVSLLFLCSEERVSCFTQS